MSRPQTTAHPHASSGHEWANHEDRIVMLLRFARKVERPCRVCGTELYFVAHGETGDVRAFTKDGVPHALNCAGRRSKKPEQAKLLDTTQLPD